MYPKTKPEISETKVTNFTLNVQHFVTSTVVRDFKINNLKFNLIKLKKKFNMTKYASFD